MSNLILASQSPRRRELLQQLQLSFTVVSSNADETIEQHVNPADAVMELAKRKALVIAEDHPNSFVVGSDTVVAQEELILGKPENPTEAKEMLQRLSGKTHSVYTGVAIIQGQKEHVFYEKTDVTFWELAEEQIDAYIATGEPFDKAGAYGIQALGAIFVKEIKGDYFSVVGLPISKVYRALKDMGFTETSI